MKKIAILGFGLEGKSLLKFLKKSSLYKKADISVLDKKLNKDYLKNLKKFDVIFRSPGVPYNLPEIQNALKKGVKISSGTELFFEQLRGLKNIKVIGITGTKGKGTTSTLIYKILKAASKKVWLAGNIGKPALEILPKLKKNSIVILELSSFQLQNLKYSSDIAIVLDIFPDHMDAHKNFREYIDAKLNIAKWQSKNDKIFYFNDNKYAKWIAEKSRAKKITVDLSFSNSPSLASTNNASRSGREWFHRIKLVIKMPGSHNIKNAVMAATVAKNIGVPDKIILKTIKKFRGLEHRLEFVRVINKIKFYNDSASTNPQTAAAAIKAFPNKLKTRALKALSARPSTKRNAFSALVLIVGGKDKNLNFSPLAQALKNSNTKLVVLFGENKNKIRKTISKRGLVIREVENLKSAVNFAYKTAKSLVANGYSLNPIIVFSPASASFDMFKDYKDRGKKFKEIVLKLK
ncbi:MAG: UDP-N-acetylmuramoyl-L-alanine--D-glutamate ligase [Patescibacteria group bacterium]